MSEYILEAINIEKNFPGVKALDKVSLQVRPGEVHALLGENGAGKSTLMKVLSGMYQPDAGNLTFKGEPLHIQNPRHALDIGIATIYQELNLCKHLSVMNNIFLNREMVRGGVIDHKFLAYESTELLNILGLFDISPYEKVANLSISKQQLVEIAKVLSMNAKVIIFDEPTSSLSSSEVDILFELILSLKKKGIAIIYISHRLEELERIADRYTVFMDGKYIETGNIKDVTIDQLVKSMIGRQIDQQFPHIKTEVGKTILELKNFTKEPYIKDISFSLKEGEILGIGGLIGAGRSELAKAIFGYYGKTNGDVLLHGKKLSISSPEQSIKAGIVYVPEDRKKEGLAINMHVQDNMIFPSLDAYSNKFGVIDFKKVVDNSKHMVDILKIKTPSIFQQVKNLSGGNQQKIVVGKWLLTKPKVIIFDEPTRGIDVNAKVNMYQEIQELKKQGIGIIVISSEMLELFGLSDRILVLSNGRQTANLKTKETNQEEVLIYATRK